MNAPLDIRICPGVFIFPFFTQDSGSGHIQKECFSAEQPESSYQNNTKEMEPEMAHRRKEIRMKIILPDGSVQEAEDELRAIRHTASHVLAQAVKRLYPDAKLAIGPAIDDGFYLSLIHI